MKKITLISVEKVVAVIDYSAFETWRAGEPIQTSDKILEKVKSCAFSDGDLTEGEYISIIKLADQAHIKMMEDNFNEGWK